MAKEDTLFIVDFLIETPISTGFPIATVDYRRLSSTNALQTDQLEVTEANFSGFYQPTLDHKAQNLPVLCSQSSMSDQCRMLMGSCDGTRWCPPAIS